MPREVGGHLRRRPRCDTRYLAPGRGRETENLPPQKRTGGIRDSPRREPPRIGRQSGRKTPGRTVLMPPRACISCLWPVPPGRRCPNPRCPRSRRAPSRGAGRSNAERVRRRKVVEAWTAAPGRVCPGYRRDAHVLRPGEFLTADHITPTSVGGDPAGPLAVLCNRCNVRKSGANRIRRTG